MSENVTELLAEIERLRADIEQSQAETIYAMDEKHDFVVENARLRARVAELEAELAIMRGTLAPHPADDEPGNYTHDVAPNAPR